MTPGPDRLQLISALAAASYRYVTENMKKLRSATPEKAFFSFNKAVKIGGLLIFIALGVPSGNGVEDRPAGPGFEGSLDKVEVSSVGGWAWDGSRPETPIQVEIYDGKTLLTTMTAAEFRDDLKKAGKGDGKHAFNFALPATLRDGQSHAISVRYAGFSSELPGSPKTLVFPKP